MISVAHRSATRRKQRAGRAPSAQSHSSLPASPWDVSAAHIDSVANALARLDPDQRDQLTTKGQWIAVVAAHATPGELSRALTKRARQLPGNDGIARFERQRRATTLRHWIDQITGMVCIHGEFDPEIGARMIAALNRRKERLFHDAVPDTCPADDRKHGHLTALALAHLIAHPGENRDTGDRDTGDNPNQRHPPPVRPAPSPGPEFIW